MATLSIQTTGRAGTDLDAVAVAADVAGDKFANAGAQLAWFKNASGASITITLVMTGTVDGQAPVNKTVVVAAGKEFLVGPFPPAWYNDANGNCSFTYSAVTSLTVAILQLGS